jgi:glycerol uptake operon antiterminator
VDFTASMQRNPIVASVNDLGRLDAALQSPCEIIFLLKGDIFSIPDVVGRIHQADKRVYVHFDLMEGFSREQVALRYLKEKANPDGIITTRVNLIKFAKEFEFSTIQRVFMLDSLSVETAIKSVKSTRPHAIELLPGIIPRVVKRVSQETQIPLIAGGLIESKEDILATLQAGAVGISTTKEELWYL